MRAPKYPRVMVSPERHIKLAEEVKKRNAERSKGRAPITIASLAEEKFKKAK